MNGKQLRAKKPFARTHALTIAWFGLSMTKTDKTFAGHV